MPARITLNVGQYLEIQGVPVCLVSTRSDLAVLAVGSYDADGLLEGPSEVKTAANLWRKQFDRDRQTGKDSGNSVPPQASG